MKAKRQTKTTQRELCRFSVAGVQYSDYQCVLGLRAGKEVKMVWERSNKHDSDAIRLDVDGVKIGYVPRGEFQDLLHKYRRNRVKVNAKVAAYNKNNPTWYMITIAVTAREIVNEPVDVAFNKYHVILGLGEGPDDMFDYGNYP